jgi:hypothetical protein
VTALAVLARHPTWCECPVCGELFTSDAAFTAQMTSQTSRTCRGPARVQEGNRRLVFDQAYGAWRWQTGDRPPPARRTPPPRPGGRVRSAGAGVRGVKRQGEAAVDLRRAEGRPRQPAPDQTPNPEVDARISDRRDGPGRR